MDQNYHVNYPISEILDISLEMAAAYVTFNLVILNPKIVTSAYGRKYNEHFIAKSISSIHHFPKYDNALKMKVSANNASHLP